jgi:hypothetical protein
MVKMSMGIEIDWQHGKLYGTSFPTPVIMPAVIAWPVVEDTFAAITPNVVG